MPSSNSKKLVNAAHEGDVAADEDIETPDDVKMCCVCGRVDKVLRCSKCHATHYCSKECQREHFPYHSVYCYTIVDLQKLEVEKLYRNHSVREDQLSSKIKKKIVNLVGSKPVLTCQLNGKEFDVLWDTGGTFS